MEPASLTFTSQVIGTVSATQSLTVTNTGTADLVVSGATLGGTDPTQFAIAANGCTTVVPAASCIITVRFQPTTTGTKSAQVAIAHNAVGSPTNVPLSGTLGGVGADRLDSERNAGRHRERRRGVHGPCW